MPHHARRQAGVARDAKGLASHWSTAYCTTPSKDDKRMRKNFEYSARGAGPRLPVSIGPGLRRALAAIVKRLVV